MFIAETACKSTALASELRLAIDRKRLELATNPYGNPRDGCHSVQVCKVAHELLEDGWSDKVVSYPSCLVLYARVGLSPKCVLEGIPECSSLLQNLRIVKENCVAAGHTSLSSFTYTQLVRQLATRGVTSRTRYGRKLRKVELRQKFDQHSHVSALIHCRLLVSSQTKCIFFSFVYYVYHNRGCSLSVHFLLCLFLFRFSLSNRNKR